jgi:lipoprotein-anchoring transpeptidase ErfK/SrfK
VFQKFDLELSEESGDPKLTWNDDTFDIHLQSLFRDRSAFETLSDASEPEDYVRRFLEVLSSSLDEPAIGHDGATIPLIRWQAGADGESAQVQLLGLLLADENQFSQFCQSQDSDLGLIFEDAEVQAHGLRETLTVMALLGVSLSATTQAEAGLFKFKEKKQAREQARQQQIMQQQAIQKREAAIQRAQQTGYLDIHNDAYINYQLLESNKDAERTVIVDISQQRAYLLLGNVVAIDTAVSTARSDKHTPRGEFKITQRVAEGKTSSIYGCDLPYWQRLDQSAIGMHVGDLPGHPASAGCIRLPYSVAPVLFANTASGVTVKVVDQWNQQELHQGSSQQNLMVAQVVERASDS